jgi:dipeptidase E
MKKGYIILSGGGDVKTTFQLDEKYFALLKNNTKILYIPIALNRTTSGYEACYDWFSNFIFYHSGKKNINFTMLLENNKVPDFNEFGSIYIGGGNTYKLLDFFYRKNINDKLVEYVKNGGIIYGGSAGAIVLGKDIRTVEEENDKNYYFFKGLDLLKGKSIICHYKIDMDKKIFEVAKKINSEIIALPENSGLILNQNGEFKEKIGNIFIFDKNNKKQNI